MRARIIFFNQLFVHIDENVGFAAELACDGDFLCGWVRLKNWCQTNGDKDGKQGGGNRHFVFRFLQYADAAADQYGEQGGQQRAGKRHRHVVAVDAEQNQVAQAACADKRGECCRADNQYGRGTDAGNHGGQRHRQFNAPQRLPSGQAERGVRFFDGGVDLAQTEIGVLKNRQQGVERQRNQNRRRTDADKGNQQAEQREGRDSLQDIGYLQNAFRPTPFVRQPHGERHGQRNGAKQGNQGEAEVFKRRLPQFGWRDGEEIGHKELSELKIFPTV